MKEMNIGENDHAGALPLHPTKPLLQKGSGLPKN